MEQPFYIHLLVVNDSAWRFHQNNSIVVANISHKSKI